VPPIAYKATHATKRCDPADQQRGPARGADRWAPGEALLRLLAELEQWNRSFNLTRITGRPAMIAGHLLDSLAASNELRGTRIADLGTGAVFPACAGHRAPGARVHAHRRHRQEDPLRGARGARAGAEQCACIAGACRSAAAGAAFDTILARALAALPELARLARRSPPPARS